MIVFNLSCSHSHRFDGWFRSATDFETQAEGGLIECPLCGDRHIEKHLSAPRINAGAAPEGAEKERRALGAEVPQGTQEMLAASSIPGLQQHLMTQFKAYVLAHTENVGPQFAETARRMHYGEEARRNIRGKVSLEDAQALQEEGIDTLALPPGLVLDENAH